MDFANVKSVTIPQGNVVKIERNGVTLWNKSRYQPIVPSEIRKYPVTLTGFGTVDLGTLKDTVGNYWRILSTSTYSYFRAVPPTNAFAPRDIGSYYPFYCSVYKSSYSTNDNVGGDKTIVLNSQFITGTPQIRIRDDSLTSLTALHEVIDGKLLLYELAESDGSVWNAVKDTQTGKYGYYNEDTDTFVEAYGMSEKYSIITPSNTTVYPAVLQGFTTVDMGTFDYKLHNSYGFYNTADTVIEEAVHWTNDGEAAHNFCSRFEPVSYNEALKRMNGTSEHPDVPFIAARRAGLNNTGFSADDKSIDPQTKENFKAEVSGEILLYELADAHKSEGYTWYAVKDTATGKYGYYNEDTDTFVEAYGMT